MKILQINKFWYRHGGADVYAIDLAKLLESNGHEVFYFGMDHPNNIKTKDEKFFVSYRAIGPQHYAQSGDLIKKAKTAIDVVYSREAACSLERLLSQHKPDIAHLHNIYHHLSPSILGVLARHKIPVVQTLHDYKRLCPNHMMYTQSKVCERCKGHKYWNAVKYKCIYDAILPSAVVATEMSIQAIKGWYDRYIDTFICPSRFMKNKLKEWGRRVDNAHVIHYPVSVSDRKYEVGKRVLYVGRLSEEKGIKPLIKSIKALSDIPFDIVGAGPLSKYVDQALKKGKVKNVILHGYKTKTHINKLLREARAVVVPSVWYENYPLSLLESAAFGRAAIGSDIGGIPEIIKDGKTGFLVKPGDSHDLSEKIEKLWLSPSRAQEMGRAARAQVKRTNAPKAHYKKIIDVYEKTISAKKKSKKSSVCENMI